MELIISVLVLAVCALSYVIYNLLRKVEKYEDATLRYSKGLENLAELLADSTKYLRELDTNGHFQVDDELGKFFEAMKKVQQEINDTFLDIEDNA